MSEPKKQENVRVAKCEIIPFCNREVGCRDKV